MAICRSKIAPIRRSAPSRSSESIPTIGSWAAPGVLPHFVNRLPIEPIHLYRSLPGQLPSLLLSPCHLLLAWIAWSVIVRTKWVIRAESMALFRLAERPIGSQVLRLKDEHIINSLVLTMVSFAAR